MARFLLSTLPGAGCVAPAQPVAAALVRRGHEVWWHTGRERQAMVTATGARFLPYERALSWDDLPPEPDPGQRGFAAVTTMMRRLLVDRAAGQLADYQAIIAGIQVDVVVSDGSCLGARLLHERGGPPWAVLHDTALIGVCGEDPPHGSGWRPPRTRAGRQANRTINWVGRRLLLRAVTEAYRDCRRGVGLPPVSGGGRTVVDALVSPYLYIQPATPAFEYPRRAMPRQVHLVGPLLPDPPDDFDPPPWWGEVTGADTVVHVTQGTTATDPTDLLLPAVRGLAGRGVLVVATVAGNDAPAYLPGNVRFERHVPHRMLLPHVDVMVTNGGYNGVLAALAHGVPLVAAGWRIDHPEVCARIAWSGAGIWLNGTRPPAPERVAAAVDEILADPGYRERARRVAAEFAAADGPATAAGLLERLAATGSPVLRTGAP
jgi:UDP:flavonoid glycosyltransferase YjiC (YdhE family)